MKEHNPSKLWEVRSCWPLFRKKCELCYRKFRWERGVKWQRVPGVVESTRYLCAHCKPSARVITRDGVERWIKVIKRMRPPKMHNCRCDTLIVDDVTVPQNPRGITVKEAAENFARAGALARVRLEGISSVCKKCILADSETIHDQSADAPDTDPISMTICKDNGEDEQITFTDNLDPCEVTAAAINAELCKAGYDASMVSAMTPLHMLENAEKRMVSAEERCKKAQDREQAWVDWFEKLRVRYDGVVGVDTPGKYLRRWSYLEDASPWPSLEDERVQAIEDI